MKKVQQIIKSLLLVLVLCMMVLGLHQVYASEVVDSVTTDEAKVDYDLNAITIKTQAIASFPVTYKSVYGSTILYESNNNDVIDVTKIVETNGWVIVKRSTENDQTAKIKVTVSLGEITKSKSVDVNVPKGNTITKTFNVEYDLDGKEVTNPNPVSHKAGDYVELSPLTAQTFVFSGWYSDESRTTKITCLPVGINKDVKVYAKWEAISIKGIEITNQPNKVVYNALEEFDSTGLVVSAVYSNNEKVQLSTEVYSIDKTVLHGNDTKVIVKYYEYVAEINITVNKLNYDLNEVEITSEYIYDGEKHTINVANLPNGLRFELLDSESAPFEAMVNAGEYAVTISYFNDSVDYNDVENQKLTLKITKRDITIAIDNKEHIYGDEFKELTSQITTGEMVEADQIALYLVIIDQSNNVGEYVISTNSDYESNTNYLITVINGTYTITAAPLKIKVKDYLIPLGAELPVIECEFTGFKYKDTELDLTGTAVFTGIPENTNIVGTYRISVSGLSNENYKITFEEGNLTINESSVRIEVSEEQLSKVYNAQPITIIAKFYNNEEEVKELNVEYIYTQNEVEVDPINVGEYTVTIKFTHATLGSGSQTFVLKITKASITIEIEEKGSAYGDDLVELKYSLTGNIYLEDNETIKEAITLKTEAEKGSNVGSYRIFAEVSELQNYSYEIVEAKYQIFQKELKIKFDDVQVTYREEYVSELTYKVYFNDTELIDFDSSVLDLTITLNPNYNISTGEYLEYVNVENGNSNYSLIIESKVIVKPRAITITVEDKTSVYGEELVELTYTITNGIAEEGDELNVEMILEQEAINVGVYNIAATASNGNYDITIISGKYTITKAIVKVIINDATMNAGSSDIPVFSYGATPSLELNLLYYVGNELVNDLDLSTYEAGTYEITAILSEELQNYEIEITTKGILTITLSDIDSVSLDADALQAKYENVLIGSLKSIDDLDIVGTNGSIIEWTSNNTGVTISNEGVVTVSAAADSQEIELTATISKNNYFLTISFTFIISLYNEVESKTYFDYNDASINTLPEGWVSTASTYSNKALKFDKTNQSIQIPTYKFSSPTLLAIICSINGSNPSTLTFTSSDGTVLSAQSVTVNGGYNATKTQNVEVLIPEGITSIKINFTKDGSNVVIYSVGFATLTDEYYQAALETDKTNHLAEMPTELTSNTNFAVLYNNRTNISYQVTAGTDNLEILADGTVNVIRPLIGETDVIAKVSISYQLDKLNIEQEIEITIKAEQKASELQMYSTTFTNKNLAVGAYELEWSADQAANNFESEARGVQFGTNKGIINVTSSLTNLKVSTITLVLSTNGTGNTASVSVGGTKLLDSEGNETVTIASGTANNNKEYTFSASKILEGQITIILNDTSKSVYIKQIIINKQ